MPMMMMMTRVLDVVHLADQQQLALLLEMGLSLAMAWMM